MKSVKFHLKLKDIERKAGLSHKATEEIRVSVSTYSQFGALYCGSLNWPLVAEAKQQILLTPHVQSGSPAGNAQSIPPVLPDVNEVMT